MNYEVGYEAIVRKPGIYRVSLEPRQEGVYVNLFESEAALEPCIDMLQADLAMAKHSCRVRYGISDKEWTEIPNEPWHTVEGQS